MTRNSAVRDSECEQDTKARLIAAAGPVFAAHGYANATVRDICAAANANQAAINYHFGGKDKLYHEVIRWACAQSHAKYPIDETLLASAKTAPEQLHFFIKQMLSRFLDPQKEDWMFKVFMQEIASPSSALDMMINETARPNFVLLQAIIKNILGRDDSVLIEQCAFTVMAQCVFYFQSRPFIVQLCQAKQLPDDCDALAAFITSFSIAGIITLREAA